MVADLFASTNPVESFESFAFQKSCDFELVETNFDFLLRYFGIDKWSAIFTRPRATEGGDLQHLSSIELIDVDVDVAKTPSTC